MTDEHGVPYSEDDPSVMVGRSPELNPLWPTLDDLGGGAQHVQRELTVTKSDEEGSQ